MINLENFTTYLKASWIKRYTIDKLDDHGADMVDMSMGINRDDRNKLEDDTIDAMRVKRMKLNFIPKALPSNMNDALTRVKLGRTLFVRSGVHAGVLEEEWCGTCLREDNQEIEDSVTHSLLADFLMLTPPRLSLPKEAGNRTTKRQPKPLSPHRLSQMTATKLGYMKRFCVKRNQAQAPTLFSCLVFLLEAKLLRP